MSWSEIKKAVNSDLSTPLNTLINNRPKGYKLVLDSVESGTITSSAPKTFSTSAGGVLHIAGSYFNNDAYIKATVDGATVNLLCYANYNNTGTGAVNNFLIPYNSNVVIERVGGSASSSVSYSACNYKYVPIT